MRVSSFIYKESDSLETWVFNPLIRKIQHFSCGWDAIIKKATENEELKNNLLNLGLLTNTANYSEEIKEYFRRKQNQIHKSLNVCFTITTKCDLSCRYCFQNHLKREDTSTEIIDTFCVLLNKKLSEEPGIKKVIITLFGGEPLIRLDLCLHLLNSVRNICETKGVKNYFSMTTNGLYAESAGLDSLNSAGLKSVQITFDGSEELHNKLRGKNFVNKNMYAFTLENLFLYIERFTTTLKYNINKNQSNESFTAFLKALEHLNLLSKVKINIEALQEPLANRDDSFFFKPNDPNLAKTYLSLANIAHKFKVAFDISSAFRPPCMVTSDSSFMIQPDGTISSCVSAYNMPELTLGNIQKLDNLDLNRDYYRNLIMEAASKMCINRRCPFFPICGTGCFFVKTVEGLAFEQPYCRSAFYSHIIPGLIRLSQRSNKCSLNF